MPCEICLEMSQGFGEDSEVAWLDFGIEIISAPSARLCLEERCLYQFFLDSGLVWKVDHIDEYGHCWLCVQHDEGHYESLTPLEGTYRKIPCEPAYPVPRRLVGGGMSADTLQAAPVRTPP